MQILVVGSKTHACNIYIYVYSPQRQNIKKERQTGTEKYNVQLQANTNND